ncbi:MAG: type II toxin-antitoxin system HicA family toxin, partial [Bacteroidetes bacterium]
MGKHNKLLIKILTGRSDHNIDFNQLCQLLKILDFEERIKGSHHIYFKENIEEIINIQEKNG